MRFHLTRQRRALVLGLLLATFALVLAVGGGAAWCDAERFGLFLQTSAAHDEVPALDFTLDDANAYPDIQAALSAVGTPVKARDPETARAYLDRMAAENVVAVRVQQGKFYLASYEETPSDAWRTVCE